VAAVSPPAVTVYRFDNGAVIKRMLNGNAVHWNLPEGSDARHTWEVIRGVREGRAAIYMLFVPGEEHAVSLAHVVTGSKVFPRWTFDLRDLVRIQLQPSDSKEYYRTYAPYWRPFIEDTIWSSDKSYTRWSGFYWPSFIDDRIYERLAHPPDNLDKKIEASKRKLIELETRKDTYSNEIQEQIEDELLVFYDLGKRWLLQAFDGEDLEGISSTWPTYTEYIAAEPDKYIDTNSIELRFRNWNHLERGDDAFLVFGLDRRFDDRSVMSMRWHLDTSNVPNMGDPISLIGQGETPLSALQWAGSGGFHQNIVILPVSKREDWYAANFKAGHPTFDMEIYHLLDVGGPVLSPHDWFVTWAAQEFGP